jgi:hypothetical protein
MEGDIGIYGMAVLAYFSYGISVFSLKNCGITIFEIMRYTVRPANSPGFIGCHPIFKQISRSPDLQSLSPDFYLSMEFSCRFLKVLFTYLIYLPSKWLKICLKFWIYQLLIWVYNFRRYTSHGPWVRHIYPLKSPKPQSALRDRIG